MKLVNDPGFLPQIVLAGAPKCGTTSIFSYLKDHPEICASSVKETYYLIDKGYPLYRENANVLQNGWIGYKEYFSHCAADSVGLRLEATPDYLYQQTPLEVIPNWPNTPKIFFVLRRPEERVYSLYRFAQNNLGILEKSLSFEEFLCMVGIENGPLSSRTILSNAIEHSKYITYLLAWRKAIGRENMCIFLLEDFRENPNKFMAKIATYLDIDPSFYQDYKFQVKNETYNIKYQHVHRWKNAASPYIEGKKLRTYLGKLYKKMNISRISGAEDSDKIAVAQLASQFNEPNRRLALEFDVDLSPWRSR